MSGLYPHQAGVGHMMNDRGFDGYRGDLNRNCVTIPEVLEVGRLSFLHVRQMACHQSDPSEDRCGQAQLADAAWIRSFLRNHSRSRQLLRPQHADARQRVHFAAMPIPSTCPSRWPTANSTTPTRSPIMPVEFIREHHYESDDQPFFMYVSFTAAHWPMHALEKDIAKYKGKYDAGYDAIRDARYKRMVELGLIDESSTVNWPIPDDWKETEHGNGTSGTWKSTPRWSTAWTRASAASSKR